MDPEATEPDLAAIATDLADVETALQRLDDGSYWVDEVTGEPLAASTLADRPTARRAALSDDGSDGTDRPTA